MALGLTALSPPLANGTLLCLLFLLVTRRPSLGQFQRLSKTVGRNIGWLLTQANRNTQATRESSRGWPLHNTIVCLQQPAPRTKYGHNIVTSFKNSEGFTMSTTCLLHQISLVHVMQGGVVQGLQCIKATYLCGSHIIVAQGQFEAVMEPHLVGPCRSGSGVA